MADNFPHPIPNGWFPLMPARDLAAGEMSRVQAMGEEYLLFKTESGEISVVDPYCPHLGAHLGVGGRVLGEEIVCPFHGWRFGVSGECKAVPYASRTPQNVSLKRITSSERNGWVFIWYHGEGKEPFYDIAEIAERFDSRWLPPERHEWTIHAQMQELFENVCDPAHFLFVHGTAEIPQSNVRFDGVNVYSTNPAKMQTRKGEVDGRIDAHTVGPGFGSVRYQIVSEMLQLTYTLPIDDDSMRVSHEFYVREGDAVGPALIRQICGQMEQDIPIWENKRYIPRPRLCDGDGPIAEGRNWMQQFYSPSIER